MTTLARRHFERVTAARQAANVDPGASMEGASQYELMLVNLHADRRRLHDVQSSERKAAVKRELLPAYADYVAGVLAGGRGAQDDVLVTVMVWRIDAGDYAGAIEIARYVLQHGLTMPDTFERKVSVVLAEEFAESALAALDLKDGEGFSAELLSQVGELTDSQDMPDEVRAKLLKAYAYALLRGHSEPDAANYWRFTGALTALQRAVQLNPRVGVKQDIGRLEKQLAKATPPEKTETNPAGGTSATGE